MSLFLLAYLAAHGLLCIHGLHRAWLVLQTLRPAPVRAPGHPDGWPSVCVQCPVFNERDVVERLVDAVANMDYPSDKLEIQVLDDSTDDTAERAEQACERARGRGLRATVLHRAQRVGYKAGALAAGLQETRAEVIAIFDADFLPAPDFLVRTVPYIVAGAGMVQGRWGHLNPGQNSLTWLQVILLDGHFALEQPARWRARRWIQFNGTAGVWARAAIDQGGGWEHDTLTEDLDLSYRAQVAGARFVYLDDLVVPAELPATMAAFQAQQRRWGRGMAQALVKCAPGILASRASPALKFEALLHLSSALSWPIAAMTSVVLPLTLWLRHAGHLKVPWYADLALFSLATFPILVFYIAGAVRAGGPGVAARVAGAPLAMALGVGLAPGQTLAVLGGLWTRAGEFVRTPKAGYHTSSSYRAVRSWFWLVEVLLALWMFGSALLFVLAGWPGATPFLLLFGVGYGYVGLGAAREAIAPHATTSNAGNQVNGQSQPASTQLPESASQDDNTA